MTVALFVATRSYVGHPNDTPAFVSGVLAMLTLGAILVQVFINRKQWESMSEQRDVMQSQLEVMKQQAAVLNPRLRVADVRLVNAEVGESPGFLVWVANQGAVDAQDVTVFLSIESDFGKGVTKGEWETSRL